MGIGPVSESPQSVLKAPCLGRLTQIDRFIHFITSLDCSQISSYICQQYSLIFTPPQSSSHKSPQRLEYKQHEFLYFLNMLVNLTLERVVADSQDVFDTFLHDIVNDRYDYRLNFFDISINNKVIKR